MNPKNKGNKPRFEVSKEDLEKLLKEKPCTEIGKMFGVSDNAIKKRAKKLGIVLQDKRGYWAKVYAGQTPELLDEHD
jgi:Zn-dependent peptidase ImmA (M78 family)